MTRVDGSIVPPDAMVDGGPPPDGAPPPPPPDAGRDATIPPIGINHSFDVVARLSPDGTEPGPGGDLPAEHRFTLHLENREGFLHAIAGANGTVAEADLTSNGDLTWSLTTAMFDGFTIGLVREPGSCGGPGPVSYEQLTLGLESTETESIGRVVGTASGRVSFFGGDVIWDVPFTATFEGTLDTTPPSYRTNVIAARHHVLDGFSVLVSEPISRSVVVSVGDVGSLVPYTPVSPSPSAAAHFTTLAGTVIPWGGYLGVAFTPNLVDLAGNVAPPEPPVAPPQAIDDPGLLAQDGFETTVNGYREGDVIAISPSSSAAPAALFGSGALFVGPGEPGVSPGGRFTARLTVPEGATRLRARVRALSSFGASGFYGRFRIAAPNVPTIEDSYVPSDPTGTIEPSGYPPLPDASPIVEMDVALPMGAAGEVIIDIDARQPTCGGLLPPPSGLVIDDLRIE